MISYVMPSCVPNPGVLAFIHAVSDDTESPAVACSTPMWGSALGQPLQDVPNASSPEKTVSISASAQHALRLTIKVAATPRSYSWLLTSGQTIVESGWGRLKGHEGSAPQTLQAISDASCHLPAKSPVLISLGSAIVLKAIREDRVPSTRLGGLWRQLREQLADHDVSVSEVAKDDIDYRAHLKLLKEAEASEALPAAIEGAGWLRFSTFNGVQAAPAPQSAPKASKLSDSAAELPYDTDGMIRAVRYGQDGARIPALHRTARPAIITSISASSDEDGNCGGLIGLLKKRTSALKASEVAKLLSISPTQTYRLAESGRIPCFRIGTAVRFDPNDLAAWLRARRVA